MNYFITFIFILTLTFNSFSQELDSSNCASIKSYFTNKPIDVHLLIKAPLKWNKIDVVAFGGLAGLSTLAYYYDERITKEFLKAKNNNIDKLTQYMFQPLGNGYIVYPSILLTMGFSCLTHNKKLTFLTLTSSKALFYTGFFTQLTKYAAHRYRPYESNGNSKVWHGLSLDSQHHSFVSGHSSTAFALATSIVSVYNDKPIIKWTSYGLASCVALSRVYDNKHWMSDVIVGSALGYAVSRFCYNNDVLRNKKNSLSIIPSQNGMQIIWMF